MKPTEKPTENPTENPTQKSNHPTAFYNKKSTVSNPKNDFVKVEKIRENDLILLNLGFILNYTRTGQIMYGMHTI